MDTSQWYSEIRRECRGCPTLTMDYAVKRSAREFCAETWYVRRASLIAVPASTLSSTYSLVTTSPNEQVAALKHAQIQAQSGGTIYPLRFLYGEYVDPNIGAGLPRGLTPVPGASYAFALDRETDVPYYVTVEYVATPILDGVYVPDELGPIHFSDIGYGALKWLCMQKDDPWYDPQRAAYYAKAFDNAIIRARGEAAFDFTPGTRAQVIPSFSHNLLWDRGWRNQRLG